MALVVIKIGENEKPDYPKFGKLGKHLEIIDVLPRHKTSSGVKGDKHYLVLNVDFGAISDEQYNVIRWFLRSVWEEDEGEIYPTGEPKMTKKAKRLFKIDAHTQKSILKLSDEKLIKLEEFAEKRRNHQEYDAREVTDLNEVITLKKFFKAVINKKTLKDLDEELGAETNTIKQIIDIIKGH